MIEALIVKGYHITKVKELETESGQTSDSSTNISNISIGNNSTNAMESQVERYTLHGNQFSIKQLNHYRLKPVGSVCC